MNLWHYGDGITNVLAKSVSEISQYKKLYVDLMYDAKSYWTSKRYPFHEIHFKADQNYCQKYWSVILQLFKQKKIGIILVKQDHKPAGFIIFQQEGEHAILYRSPIFTHRPSEYESHGELNFLLPEIIHEHCPEVNVVYNFIARKIGEVTNALRYESLLHLEEERFLQEGLNCGKWKLIERCPIVPDQHLIRYESGEYSDAINPIVVYDLYSKRIRE